MNHLKNNYTADIWEAEPLGLEEIEAGADNLRVEQVIHSLTVKIWRWRQEHPGRTLRVGLVMDGTKDE